MRPDAVIIPKALESGPDKDARKESIVEVAEPLLECGPRELAWCRDQMTYFFCTRDADDTEKYPLLHPESGRPRYEWKPGPNGTKLGYLRCES